jgi:D-3-phosphoglycerate dehydrogenase / 2-oxoglutarate reductase
VTFRVVITDCPWQDVSVEQGILERAGAEVRRANCSTPEDVVAACHDADALLVGWAPLPAHVIPQLTRCRLIARYGTGYDNIDVGAATAAGIGVSINADYCVDEVATHALALILACHRQLGVLTHAVGAGTWDPFAVMTPMRPLRELSLGILGFGRIGRRLAEMALPLVARVLVHDPFAALDDDPDGRRRSATAHELFSESDFVSIHAPLSAATRHFVSTDSLRQMKPTAYVINCARGPIVDEAALIAALRDKRIGGAALDVFEVEPLPADHALRAFPNVIVTPHAAWYSQEADYRLRANPANTVVRFFAGETVPLVNPSAVPATSR